MPALPTETYYYRKNTGQDNETSLAATDWTEDADGTFTGDVGDTYDAVCVGPSRIARKVNDNTVTLGAIGDLDLAAGETGALNIANISTGSNRKYSVSGPTWFTMSAGGLLGYEAPSLVSAFSTTVTITVSNSVSSASRTINVDVAAAPVAPEPGTETVLTDNGNGTMTTTYAPPPTVVLTDNGNGTMTTTYS